MTKDIAASPGTLRQIGTVFGGLFGRIIGRRGDERAERRARAAAVRRWTYWDTKTGSYQHFDGTTVEWEEYRKNGNYL
jgi:hypothetical protein